MTQQVAPERAPVQPYSPAGSDKDRVGSFFSEHA